MELVAPTHAWGPLRADVVREVLVDQDVDVVALESFLLVDRDLSADTVAHRLRSMRHMAATGFTWSTYTSSAPAAAIEGRRWLAWKKAAGGRSCLHNYELVLNDVARFRALQDAAFAGVWFRHTKPMYGHPEPYSSGELEALLQYRCVDDFVRRRRRALIWLCLNTGLRRTEISRILVEDLDQGLGVLHVPRPAKGGKPRSVPLPREAWSPRRPLQAYLRARARVLAETGKFHNGNLWNSRTGAELGRNMLSKETMDLSTELGFAVSFNRFRRTRATHLARAGVGLATMQSLYGHADPRSTKWYFELTAEDLRRDLERCGVAGFSAA